MSPMVKNVYWEDVAIGTEVTPLPKVATTEMLVKWAGAAGDFNPVHYEDSYAHASGLDRSIVHGQLKRAWLVQMMTDWIGEGGTLQKLSCRMKAPDYPRLMKDLGEPQEGETWWCKGKVTGKHVADGKYLVECEICIENGIGERTTTGNAVVSLPSRA